MNPEDKKPKQKRSISGSVKWVIPQVRRTALVVDDEKKVRNMYRRFLVTEDFDVLEAENGEQACSVMVQKEKVDLVLLDIRMPVVGGAGLFGFIRHRHPESKVIVSSVYPTDDQRLMIQGADGYFDKSDGIDVLLSKIRTVLPSEENPPDGSETGGKRKRGGR